MFNSGRQETTETNFDQTSTLSQVNQLEIRAPLPIASGGFANKFENMWSNRRIPLLPPLSEHRKSRSRTPEESGGDGDADAQHGSAAADPCPNRSVGVAKRLIYFCGTGVSA
jgi:hypothetical protein